MISENTFDVIRERALEYAYSSFEYLEYDVCRTGEIIRDDEPLILLCDAGKSPALIQFAFEDIDVLIQALSIIPGDIQINFVPYEFRQRLEEIGFFTWGEFIDFWNTDLSSTIIKSNDHDGIEFLKPDECGQVSAVSRKCANQSRGFSGETEDWFSEWLKDNDVIILRKDGKIAGFCCVSIYNSGTTLWIREIAVDPECQGKGLGGKLIAQAICYGLKHGAKKGFLAVDVQNDRAIRLYNKYGFCPKELKGELQMVYRSR